MARTTTYRVTVQFGDCDPAGIVFFPNFSRWMDQASLAFFMQCSVPPWKELVKTRGIVGTPLLEIHTVFKKAATYTEELLITTYVEAWRAKTFTQVHRITRAKDGRHDGAHSQGDVDLICEGRETRAFVKRDAEDSERLRAIAVPEDIKALCE